MKQQITVYLSPENLSWLKKEGKSTGLGMSGLVSMYVSNARKADRNSIGEVNRSLENARLADLENEEV